MSIDQQQQRIEEKEANFEEQRKKYKNYHADATEIPEKPIREEIEMTIIMQMTRFVKVKAENFEAGKIQALKLHDGFHILAIYESEHGAVHFNI